MRFEKKAQTSTPAGSPPPPAPPPNGTGSDGQHPRFLCGATEISIYVFGTPDRRRTIFYLAENCRIPIFRIGARLHARPSTIDAWVKEQEEKGWRGINDNGNDGHNKD